MLLKTPTFDNIFKNDIKELAINSNYPFREMGSYKIKEFGEPITDIDLTAFVYFNSKLLTIISSIIRRVNKGSKFFFLHMNCGIRKEFELPWTIDNDGGCNFNLKQLYEWFEQFVNNKRVPPHILEYIGNKVIKNILILRDLIDIENIIKPFAEILWNIDDIQRGFKIIDGHKYNLLDIMKSETPVLEYVYIYENNIIAVDVGLLDKRYRNFPRRMYSYYMDDWYKIMKSYRWKLLDEFRQEYLNVMKHINLFILVKYKIDLYKRIKPYNDNLTNIAYKDMMEGLEMLNMDFNESIEEELYEHVNNYLSKYIEYFISRLKPEFRTPFYIYLKRGIEAQIPTSLDVIKERESYGIKCPFFSTDIDDFEKIVNLSIRVLIDTDEMIKCINYISNKLNISIKEVIYDLGNNTLALYDYGDNIVVTQDGIEIYTRPKKDLKLLQRLVIIG